jgi:hypothetical protein
MITITTDLFVALLALSFLAGAALVTFLHNRPAKRPADDRNTRDVPEDVAAPLRRLFTDTEEQPVTPTVLPKRGRGRPRKAADGVAITRPWAEPDHPTIETRQPRTNRTRKPN